MSNTLLVTGGAGYIGSHFVLESLNRGYKVVVIDNLSRTTNKNIQTLLNMFPDSLTFIQFDLTNKINSDVFSKLDGIQAIFHFAALKSVGESVMLPDLYYSNNINSLINVINIAKNLNCKRIVFSSTASIYGNTDDKPVTEDYSTNPENPYAFSKLFCEQILRDAYRAYGVSSISLRYFNVVGCDKNCIVGDSTKQPQNLVPIVIMSDLGLIQNKIKIFGSDYPTRDGTAIRDYIDIQDLVEGHFLANEYLNKFEGFDVFNLGTGVGTTVLEVIRTYEEVKGSNISYEFSNRRPGDVVFSTADYRKAKSLLNWSPKVSLRESIDNMYRWYLHNREGFVN